MRRFLCFLFILFLTGKATTAVAQKSSLLWKISGNGLKQPSHIFGTFHIMCKDDFVFSDTLKKKIRSSKQFYGEIDMDDPGLQANLLMKMMSEKTIQSQMSEADFKEANEQFQKITGLPLTSFNHFKPFMCLSALAINSISCKDKIQPETVFTQLAKENKIPMLGLETVTDQLDAIDREPLDSQINSLKKAVLNFDSVKHVMLQLIEVYKLRDVDSLYSFMKSTGATDDFETAMLDERNRKWIPVMSKAMAEKPSFFAVGAGHLGGSAGVISLLQKQGYTLTPVKY